MQPATAAAASRGSDAAVAPASSSSAAVSASMLPRDALLVPLLLTLVELAQLQPSRRARLVPAALSFIMGLLNRHCPQLLPPAPATGVSRLSAAAAAAVADALAAPVLLQLAPAVMQFLTEEPAVPAGASQAVSAAADGDSEFYYMLLVAVVLRYSKSRSCRPAALFIT